MRSSSERARAAVRACGVCAFLLASGCDREPGAAPPTAAGAPSGPAPAQYTPQFRDVAAEVGIDFVHYTGATGSYYLPEIMGPGCAFLDYDGDGDLDVYAVQGALLGEGKTLADSLFPPRPVRNGAGSAPGGPEAAAPRDRLFRNDLSGAGGRGGRLHFEDVTAAAGLGDAGFGLGCAAGDYDNDGDPDLYVTNFGSNVLYRNNGDGTFTDVTRAAGVDDPRFSTSAAWLDHDRDGRLDLLVLCYVEYTLSTNRDCFRLGGQRDYCGPQSYEPAPARLFHNEGGGAFRDVSVAAGLQRRFGCGLGVVCADVDADGWIDVFVANDATPNQLWMNRKDGTFEDAALLAGVAVDGAGRNEACMGAAAGDFDRDGDEDLFVTNERGETVTLYRALERGLFEDATAAVGLEEPSLPYVGFGTRWLDADHDGWIDLFVANGAVQKLASLAGDPYPYHQPDQLYRNAGGRFADASAAAGAALAAPHAGRGVASGDVDNDGDVDLLVANNNGPLQLLLNEGPARGNWLEILLEGTRSNRDGYGARVEVALAGGARLAARAGTDGSYLSASDPRLHFGLGPAARAETVTVRWPGGLVERWMEVPANRLAKLREAEGRPAE